MSKIDNKLVANLFQSLKERKVSVPKFSKATGIPTARIYKWKQEGTNPKAEDEKMIYSWLNGENVEKDRISIPAKNEDLSIRAIHNLTETGKIHAENYSVMVNNESRLIKLLEQKSTADGQKDNGVASPKVMSGILVAMAKIASGTRWHSEDEALRELGRLLSPQVDESKIVGGIQIDEGKTNTGK